MENGTYIVPPPFFFPGQDIDIGKEWYGGLKELRK